MNYVIAGQHGWSYLVYVSMLPDKQNKWWYCAAPGDLEIILTKVNPSKIFFTHWSDIVPKHILDKHECICFHPTSLPEGRGGTPIQNLIEAGQETTTLTAFKMTEEIDAGPIYTRRYNISLYGSAQEIYTRIASYIPNMIYEIIEMKLIPVEQVGEPTYFKRRKPEDSYLKGNMDEDQLYDFIRMLDAEDYPHAFLEYGDYRLEFTDAKFEKKGLTAKVIFKNVS